MESTRATGIDGNIFYLLKYMTSCDKYSSFKIYLSSWGRHAKKMHNLLDRYDITGVNITIYASDEYVQLLASAKYLINDTTFPYYYIKKEGQVYLNTWHGTPLKTLGKMVKNDVAIGDVQKNLVDSDYLLVLHELTKDALIRDYMLENISSGSYVF